MGMSTSVVILQHITMRTQYLGVYSITDVTVHTSHKSKMQDVCYALHIQ